MGDAWSSEENALVVRTYLEMLKQELADQSFTKSDYRTRLMSRIRRSGGSIEYKFQNISAVLQQSHCPFIDGYKPRSNFQASLADEVISQLASDHELPRLMRFAVTRPAVTRTDIIWHSVIPSVPLIRQQPGRFNRAFHTDFVQLEQANQDLGLAGELAVVDRERQLLASIGRADLAEKVNHVSVTLGDGLGYDIESFDPDGEPKFIEVKTTRRGVDWPMLVSRNEVAVSDDLDGAYHLYRVFGFDRSRVGIYEVRGSIRLTCDLEPETYRALPKPNMATPITV